MVEFIILKAFPQDDLLAQLFKTYNLHDIWIYDGLACLLLQISMNTNQLKYPPLLHHPPAYYRFLHHPKKKDLKDLIKKKIVYVE